MACITMVGTSAFTSHAEETYLPASCSSMNRRTPTIMSSSPRFPREPVLALHSGCHRSIVFMSRFPVLKNKRRPSWCSNHNPEKDSRGQNDNEASHQSRIRIRCSPCVSGTLHGTTGHSRARWAGPTSLRTVEIAPKAPLARGGWGFGPYGDRCSRATAVHSRGAARHGGSLRSEDRKKDPYDQRRQMAQHRDLSYSLQRNFRVRPGRWNMQGV